MDMKRILTLLLCAALTLTAGGCAFAPRVNEAPTAAETEAETEAFHLPEWETYPIIDYTLDLPRNLRITYQEDVSPDLHRRNVWTWEIVKIGDDYMAFDMRGWTYFHCLGGLEYSVYIENDNDDGSITWKLHDRTDRLEQFFPFAWPVIETLGWYEDASGRTAEVCGIPCRVLLDRPSSTVNLAIGDADREQYVLVNEEMGVMFERGHTDCAVPTLMITEWDTSVTEFPVRPPKIE